ncbi:hypothetical protein Nepgr_013628 [Nepenthes gracilis]|uniref:NLP1-9 GAF domain-containing protein n=1 Tax=Nepenthes gracilis TaxID=150966 RepID=A0AAD3XNU4_NEPGR|nr:hypothetical protein Nepgr_013628 [Nepenthes gracilis]
MPDLDFGWTPDLGCHCWYSMCVHQRFGMPDLRCGVPSSLSVSDTIVVRVSSRAGKITMRIYWIACMQAVDLRSSKILSPSKAKSRSSVYETALPEILHVLRTACDKHNLPLAQTWAPCIQHGKGGCWHPTNHAQCVSTVDSACYVRDPRVQESHEACSEHHLLRGQGVVGEAFMTNHPRVATDVTAFTKAEYSLSP